MQPLDDFRTRRATRHAAASGIRTDVDPIAPLDTGQAADCHRPSTKAATPLFRVVYAVHTLANYGASVAANLSASRKRDSRTQKLFVWSSASARARRPR